MNSQLDSNGYASNSMDAIVIAKAVDTSDLNFNINIIQLNDLKSNIKIENTKISDNKSNIIIRRNEYSDLQFNINVKQISDLYSNISVTAINIMFGLVDAQHPTILSKKLIPYKDAYISSKYPTFNSGLSQGLIVGNFQGETYRSFMAFNIASLENCIITKANLVLNLQSSMDTSIRLLSFTDSWMEENITWKNQPKTAGILASANVYDKESQAVIDIRDYLQGHLDNQQYYYNFRLDDADQTNNKFICLNSRENPYSCYLDIEYYSTEVINYGKIQLKSNIIVKQNKSSDIYSKINIKRYNDVAKLPSKIVVRTPGILDSNIIINRDFVSSNINVKKYYNNSLNSKITIKKNKYEELESNIIISKSFLNANTIVTYYNNLNSSIKIRIEEVNDVTSNIVIKRNETNNLKSKINIKHFIDIPSYVNISRSIIFSNIKVRRHEVNNISSNIKIRLHESSNITGSIVISHGTVLSNIKIRKQDESNINSNIIIRLHDKNDLNGSLVISRREIQSNITIRRYGNSDLNNNIIIRPASNIHSNINVTVTNDLKSKIAIGNITMSEVHSHIIIGRCKDIKCNIIIKQFTHNDMKCNIYIDNDNGYVFIM